MPNGDIFMGLNIIDSKFIKVYFWLFLEKTTQEARAPNKMLQRCLKCSQTHTVTESFHILPNNSLKTISTISTKIFFYFCVSVWHMWVGVCRGQQKASDPRSWISWQLWATEGASGKSSTLRLFAVSLAPIKDSSCHPKYHLLCGQMNTNQIFQKYF